MLPQRDSAVGLHETKVVQLARAVSEGIGVRFDKGDRPSVMECSVLEDAWPAGMEAVLRQEKLSLSIHKLERLFTEVDSNHGAIGKPRLLHVPAGREAFETDHLLKADDLVELAGVAVAFEQAGTQLRSAPVESKGAAHPVKRNGPVKNVERVFFGGQVRRDMIEMPGAVSPIPGADHAVAEAELPERDPNAVSQPPFKVSFADVLSGLGQLYAYVTGGPRIEHSALHAFPIIVKVRAPESAMLSAQDQSKLLPHVTGESAFGSAVFGAGEGMFRAVTLTQPGCGSDIEEAGVVGVLFEVFWNPGFCHFELGRRAPLHELLLLVPGEPAAPGFAVGLDGAVIRNLHVTVSAVATFDAVLVIIVNAGQVSESFDCFHVRSP